MQTKFHIAVIGAGAFGGWTALYLLRRGARVTLLDAWGPGNSRSSSGGETRVVRGTYGPDQPYTKMAARAMRLWKEHEERWGCRLVDRIGVLWLARVDDDQFERESLPLLSDAGIAHQTLSISDLTKRWPQINFEGVDWGIYEPDGGFVTARVACQTVLKGFLTEGGEYRQIAILAHDLDCGPCHSLALADGSSLVADRYVFACGPWLGELFPETIGDKVRPTKQDVFFFGTPAGDERFSEEKLPAWAEHHGRFMYGIPGNEGRGFKIADDSRGPEFDPTAGERVVSAKGLKAVREYLGFRFPAMKNAPLLETRVCQYENTPDNHFIIDRHQAANNVWLIGGGSGHGFKHGPALGEMVADLVFENRDAEAIFRLERFGKQRRKGAKRSAEFSGSLVKPLHLSD
jgi:monomeric sarcosine oxidase